ncbi:hypothetical protein XENTR_v10011841 [Xenopus tropicalis]|nr:hypothetical protein XENTR_v10011841 [Xenopus tropicalis]
MLLKNSHFTLQTILQHHSCERSGCNWINFKLFKMANHVYSIFCYADTDLAQRRISAHAPKGWIKVLPGWK